MDDTTQEVTKKGVIGNIADAIKDYGATSDGTSVNESLQGYKPNLGKDSRVFGMRPVNFFLISIGIIAIMSVIEIKVKIA